MNKLLNHSNDRNDMNAFFPIGFFRLSFSGIRFYHVPDIENVHDVMTQPCSQCPDMRHLWDISKYKSYQASQKAIV
jgi:hypothetical protein